MILRFIENIGDKTVSTLFSFYEALKFTSICLIYMFLPKSYNSTMRAILIKQIYYTAIAVIPLFIIMATLFGSAIIGSIIAIATQYSLQDEIGYIIIKFIVEFSPFFTVILVVLRSSTAINIKMALMQQNDEFTKLKEQKVDLINYLFLPRIISGVISVTLLCILFAIIMFFSGYIFAYFYMKMDFYAYKLMLIDAIEFKDLVALLGKSMAFGFVTMLIPLYSGLKTSTNHIVNGMVKLFIALFFIEMLSLLLLL